MPPAFVRAAYDAQTLSRPASVDATCHQSLVPWHQDRTIVVRERIKVDGFGPWSIKDGLLHVAPPYDMLARMVTLRVHLDAVPESNAPLLIVPGSH
jgi:hypothetical protein